MYRYTVHPLTTPRTAATALPSSSGRFGEADSLLRAELAQTLPVIPSSLKRDEWSELELAALKSRAHCLYGLGKMNQHALTSESLVFAEATLSQAYAIMSAMYGPESMNTVLAYSDLAIILSKRSDNPDAVRSAEIDLHGGVWEREARRAAANARSDMRDRISDRIVGERDSMSVVGVGGSAAESKTPALLSDETALLVETTVALRQYYSEERRDHTLCGVAGIETAICPSHDASYVLRRIEGLCAAAELPGTVPLHFYYNPETHDNAVARVLDSTGIAHVFGDRPSLLHLDGDGGDGDDGDDGDEYGDSAEDDEEELSTKTESAAADSGVAGNAVAMRGAAAHKRVRVACFVWTDAGNASSIGGRRRPLSLFYRDIPPTANSSTGTAEGASSRSKRDFIAAASSSGRVWAKRQNYTRVGLLGYVLSPKLLPYSPDVAADAYIGRTAGEAPPPHIEAGMHELRLRQQQNVYLARQRLFAQGAFGDDNAALESALRPSLETLRPSLDALMHDVQSRAEELFTAYVVNSRVKKRRAAFVKLRAMCKTVKSAAEATRTGMGEPTVALSAATDICTFTMSMCSQLRRRRSDAHFPGGGSSGVIALLKDEVAQLRRLVSNESAGSPQRARAQSRLEVVDAARLSLEEGADKVLLDSFASIVAGLVCVLFVVLVAFRKPMEKGWRKLKGKSVKSVKVSKSSSSGGRRDKQEKKQGKKAKKQQAQSAAASKEQKKRRQKELAVKRERKLALERQRKQAALLESNRGAATTPEPRASSQGETGAVSPSSPSQWQQVQKGGIVSKKEKLSVATPAVTSVSSTKKTGKMKRKQQQQQQQKEKAAAREAAEYRAAAEIVRANAVAASKSRSKQPRTKQPSRGRSSTSSSSGGSIGFSTPPLAPQRSVRVAGTATDPRSASSMSPGVISPGGSGRPITPSGLRKSRSWTSFSLLDSPEPSSLWSFGSAMAPPLSSLTSAVPSASARLGASGGDLQLPPLVRRSAGLPSSSPTKLRDALETSEGALRAAKALVDESLQNIVGNILGPEEGMRLFKEVEQDPDRYASDTRPFVSRLASAFKRKSAAFENRTELMKQVEAQVEDTPYVYPTSKPPELIRVKFAAECAELPAGESLCILSSLFGAFFRPFSLPSYLCTQP